MGHTAENDATGQHHAGAHETMRTREHLSVCPVCNLDLSAGNDVAAGGGAVMQTADEFPVSFITGLCGFHAEQFASLAVLVIEAPADDYPGGCSDRVDQLREYLSEHRELCESGCGRKKDADG